jgi:diguanylate cyclase (GGDEF)-like protein
MTHSQNAGDAPCISMGLQWMFQLGVPRICTGNGSTKRGIGRNHPGVFVRLRVLHPPATLLNVVDERTIEDFRKLISVTKTINSSLDIEEQLPLIMDAALSLTRADTCLLVLYNEQRELTLRAQRHADPKQPLFGSEPNKEAKYSRGVIKDVVEKGEALFILDVDLQSKIKAHESVNRLSLRTVLCTPLRSKNGIVGALYAQSATPTRAFDAHKKEIFLALSDHAAIALENARLYATSITDPLTGLYNHSYCVRRLDEELQRANRYGRYLSFLLVDCDNFRSINDTRGHRVGDRALIEIAGSVRGNVRKVDVPVRFGGNTFGAILPDTEDGSVVAGRIRQAVETMDLDGAMLTVSAGLAGYPSDGNKEGTVNDLIERAETALRAAKAGGGNAVLRHRPESFVRR